MLANLILYTTEIALCYLIPVYASMNVLAKAPHICWDDYKRWGSYWICVGVLRAVSEILISVLPNFAFTAVLFIRVCATLYLGLPQTKGSLIVWNDYLTDKAKIEMAKAKADEVLQKVKQKMSRRSSINKQ